MKQRFKDILRVMLGRNVLTYVCFAIILLFILIAILAPVLTPYTPYEQSLQDALTGPSRQYVLGTDNLGRDLLTRLLYGARISLVVSLGASILAAVVGTLLGLIAGYCGGVAEPYS